MPLIKEIKTSNNGNGLSGFKTIPTSTVGRGKAINLSHQLPYQRWVKDGVHLFHGDSMDFYHKWEKPTVIISDGGYGVLGFEGDTSDHLGLPNWYENHIKEWSKYALPSTSLWFWNSEIGWAAVHPILEKYGWRYVNANIWNKGKGHIAGNVNTSKIRRFPVVTEMCVQYSFGTKINGKTIKAWLLNEWKRTKLPLRKANEACGVADAAVRKYLDQGHLWYFPPPEMFEKLVSYANQYGAPEGKPYFSKEGKNPISRTEWSKMRYTFNCPHGFTNVWERNALRNGERVKTRDGKAVHLNQKPLDLMKLTIEASSNEKEVVWEPFGGLFSGSLGAGLLKRKAYAAEIDSTYFYYGVERVKSEIHQKKLF
ncbi:MAG: site-specific DNA-methyltransferase [Candidatus Heimdallarchaeota archaeon]|nr:site-specific DNA-methyltransferase [Candidatus Heimdallarchaeota archaeon]